MKRHIWSDAGTLVWWWDKDAVLTPFHMRFRLNIVARLALLLVALATAGASGASFASSASNPGNAFAAAHVRQENSSAGQLILSASDMVPGQAVTRTITITNSGDVQSTSTLSEKVADSPGPAGTRLSSKLQLTVDDVTDHAATNTIYHGALGALRPQALGTFSAGSAHTYRFTVTFPDDASQDAIQGAQTDVEFDWTQTS